jgi:hypothetical protein
MILLIATSMLGLYQLQAEKAKYDGKDLILNEAVEMTHPLGRLSARRAVLQNLKIDRHSPFQRLTLEGQVCVHANTPEREVNLFADRAEGEIDSGALFAFQQLSCTGSVEITTSDGFTAKGGEARYSALANRGGVIELVPAPLSQHCFLTHSCDSLQARKVRFDMATSQIICEETSGEIASSWKNGAAVAFRADHLQWQQDLLLEGHVSLDQTISIGSERIRLSFGKSQGALTQVVADGPTQMAFPNKEASLVCQGPLMLDCREHLLRTDHGLDYRDSRIHLEAGSGRLTYQEMDGALQPEALYCDGTVRLISSCIQDQESYALAEQLVYFPAMRTMILTSRAPNRVLFWQKSGNITLSAPEVHVRFDPQTKRESVSGIGDVRFRFNFQEENTIEHLFSKYL